MTFLLLHVTQVTPRNESIAAQKATIANAIFVEDDLRRNHEGEEEACRRKTKLYRSLNSVGPPTSIPLPA